MLARMELTINRKNRKKAQFQTESPRRRICSSTVAEQGRANQGDFTAINDQDGRSADEHYQRESKEQPDDGRAVGIDDHDAEFGQMPEDRDVDRSQR